MARLCERPGCSERGAIAYGFDPARLLVWLAPFDPESDRNRSGVLCLRHGDAMVVPQGWTLDDARDPGPRLFKAPKQPRQNARPSRRRTTSAKGRDDQLVLVDPVDNARPRSTAPAVGEPKSTPAPMASPEIVEGIEIVETVEVIDGGDVVEAVEILDVVEVVVTDPDDDAARTVAAVTGRSAASAEDPDATVAIPWKPEFDDTDDLGGLLDATSPLLSRAFRGRERSD